MQYKYQDFDDWSENSNEILNLKNAFNAAREAAEVNEELYSDDFKTGASFMFFIALAIFGYGISFGSFWAFVGSSVFSLPIMVFIFFAANSERWE